LVTLIEGKLYWAQITPGLSFFDSIANPTANPTFPFIQASQDPRIIQKSVDYYFDFGDQHEGVPAVVLFLPISREGVIGQKTDIFKVQLIVNRENGDLELASKDDERGRDETDPMHYPSETADPNQHELFTMDWFDAFIRSGRGLRIGNLLHAVVDPHFKDQKTLFLIVKSSPTELYVMSSIDDVLNNKIREAMKPGQPRSFEYLPGIEAPGTTLKPGINKISLGRGEGFSLRTNDQRQILAGILQSPEKGESLAHFLGEPEPTADDMFSVPWFRQFIADGRGIEYGEGRLPMAVMEYQEAPGNYDFIFEKNGKLYFAAAERSISAILKKTLEGDVATIQSQKRVTFRKDQNRQDVMVFQTAQGEFELPYHPLTVHGGVQRYQGRDAAFLAPLPNGRVQLEISDLSGGVKPSLLYFTDDPPVGVEEEEEQSEPQKDPLKEEILDFLSKQMALEKDIREKGPGLLISTQGNKLLIQGHRDEHQHLRDVVLKIISKIIKPDFEYPPDGVLAEDPWEIVLDLSDEPKIVEENVRIVQALSQAYEVFLKVSTEIHSFQKSKEDLGDRLSHAHSLDVREFSDTTSRSVILHMPHNHPLSRIFFLLVVKLSHEKLSKAMRERLASADDEGATEWVIPYVHGEEKLVVELLKSVREVWEHYVPTQKIAEALKKFAEMKSEIEEVETGKPQLSAYAHWTEEKERAIALEFDDNEGHHLMNAAVKRFKELGEGIDGLKKLAEATEQKNRGALIIPSTDKSEANRVQFLDDLTNFYRDWINNRPIEEALVFYEKATSGEIEKELSGRPTLSLELVPTATGWKLKAKGEGDGRGYLIGELAGGQFMADGSWSQSPPSDGIAPSTGSGAAGDRWGAPIDPARQKPLAEGQWSFEADVTFEGQATLAKAIRRAGVFMRDYVRQDPFYRAVQEYGDGGRPSEAIEFQLKDLKTIKVSEKFRVSDNLLPIDIELQVIKASGTRRKDKIKAQSIESFLTGVFNLKGEEKLQMTLYFGEGADGVTYQLDRRGGVSPSGHWVLSNGRIEHSGNLRILGDSEKGYRLVVDEASELATWLGKGIYGAQLEVEETEDGNVRISGTGDLRGDLYDGVLEIWQEIIGERHESEVPQDRHDKFRMEYGSWHMTIPINRFWPIRYRVGQLIQATKEMYQERMGNPERRQEFRYVRERPDEDQGAFVGWPEIFVLPEEARGIDANLSPDVVLHFSINESDGEYSYWIHEVRIRGELYELKGSLSLHVMIEGVPLAEFPAGFRAHPLGDGPQRDFRVVNAEGNPLVLQIERDTAEPKGRESFEIHFSKTGEISLQSWEHEIAVVEIPFEESFDLDPLGGEPAQVSVHGIRYEKGEEVSYSITSVTVRGEDWTGDPIGRTLDQPTSIEIEMENQEPLGEDIIVINFAADGTPTIDSDKTKFIEFEVEPVDVPSTIFLGEETSSLPDLFSLSVTTVKDPRKKDELRITEASIKLTEEVLKALGWTISEEEKEGDGLVKISIDEIIRRGEVSSTEETTITFNHPRLGEIVYTIKFDAAEKLVATRKPMETAEWKLAHRDDEQKTAYLSQNIGDKTPVTINLITVDRPRLGSRGSLSFDTHYYASNYGDQSSLTRWRTWMGIIGHPVNDEEQTFVKPDHTDAEVMYHRERGGSGLEIVVDGFEGFERNEDGSIPVRDLPMSGLEQEAIREAIQLARTTGATAGTVPEEQDAGVEIPDVDFSESVLWPIDDEAILSPDEESLAWMIEVQRLIHDGQLPEIQNRRLRFTDGRIVISVPVVVVPPPPEDQHAHRRRNIFKLIESDEEEPVELYIRGHEGWTRFEGDENLRAYDVGGNWQIYVIEPDQNDEDNGNGDDPLEAIQKEVRPFRLMLARHPDYPSLFTLVNVRNPHEADDEEFKEMQRGQGKQTIMNVATRYQQERQVQIPTPYYFRRIRALGIGGDEVILEFISPSGEGTFEARLSGVRVGQNDRIRFSRSGPITLSIYENGTMVDQVQLSHTYSKTKGSVIELKGPQVGEGMQPRKFEWHLADRTLIEINPPKRNIGEARFLEAMAAEGLRPYEFTPRGDGTGTGEEDDNVFHQRLPEGATVQLNRSIPDLPMANHSFPLPRNDRIRILGATEGERAGVTKLMSHHLNFHGLVAVPVPGDLVSQTYNGMDQQWIRFAAEGGIVFNFYMFLEKDRYVAHPRPNSDTQAHGYIDIPVPDDLEFRMDIEGVDDPEQLNPNITHYRLHPDVAIIRRKGQEIEITIKLPGKESINLTMHHRETSEFYNYYEDLAERAHQAAEAPDTDPLDGEANEPEKYEGRKAFGYLIKTTGGGIIRGGDKKGNALLVSYIAYVMQGKPVAASSVDNFLEITQGEKKGAFWDLSVTKIADEPLEYALNVEEDERGRAYVNYHPHDKPDPVRHPIYKDRFGRPIFYIWHEEERQLYLLVMTKQGDILAWSLRGNIEKFLNPTKATLNTAQGIGGNTYTGEPTSPSVRRLVSEPKDLVERYEMTFVIGGRWKAVTEVATEIPEIDEKSERIRLEVTVDRRPGHEQDDLKIRIIEGVPPGMKEELLPFATQAKVEVVEDRLDNGRTGHVKIVVWREDGDGKKMPHYLVIDFDHRDDLIGSEKWKEVVAERRQEARSLFRPHTWHYNKMIAKQFIQQTSLKPEDDGFLVARAGVYIDRIEIEKVDKDWRWSREKLEKLGYQPEEIDAVLDGLATTRARQEDFPKIYRVLKMLGYVTAKEYKPDAMKAIVLNRIGRLKELADVPKESWPLVYPILQQLGHIDHDLDYDEELASELIEDALDKVTYEEEDVQRIFLLLQVLGIVPAVTYDQNRFVWLAALGALKNGVSRDKIVPPKKIRYLNQVDRVARGEGTAHLFDEFLGYPPGYSDPDIPVFGAQVVGVEPGVEVNVLPWQQGHTGNIGYGGNVGMIPSRGEVSSPGESVFSSPEGIHASPATSDQRPATGQQAGHSTTLTSQESAIRDHALEILNEIDDHALYELATHLKDPHKVSRTFDAYVEQNAKDIYHDMGQIGEGPGYISVLKRFEAEFHDTPWKFEAMVLVLGMAAETKREDRVLRFLFRNAGRELPRRQGSTGPMALVGNTANPAIQFRQVLMSAIGR